MRSATTDEITRDLSGILADVRNEPVRIMDGGRAVAFLVSPEAYEPDYGTRLNTFRRVRDEVAAELAANLAKEGIAPEQFLAELLAND